MALAASSRPLYAALMGDWETLDLLALHEAMAAGVTTSANAGVVPAVFGSPMTRYPSKRKRPDEDFDDEDVHQTIQGWMVPSKI